VKDCILHKSSITYQPLLKKLESNSQVKQLFNTDLLHVQQCLFTKLKIEPTSKVRVEYDGSKLLEMTKADDDNDVHPPPFSLLYFDLHTYSGLLTSDAAIRVINVRYALSYLAHSVCHTSDERCDDVEYCVVSLLLKLADKSIPCLYTNVRAFVCKNP
jgi:hypothetical protein